MASWDLLSLELLKAEKDPKTFITAVDWPLKILA